MRVAILAVALALSASAEAHDLDCHGMPVPEAKKLGCCGAGDAHFGGTSQFYEDHDGFWHYLVAGEDFLLVRGAPENMTQIRPLPSTDGCNWVWYRRNDPQTGTWPPDGSGTGSDLHFYCLRLVFSF